MAKITLQQKWDDLIAQSKIIKTCDINQFFESHPKPEALFKVDNVGNIKQIEITDFSVFYRNGKQNIYPPYLDKGKRPTNLLVIQLAEYLEIIQKCEKSIYVGYKEFGSGAYNYFDILVEKGIAFQASELEQESKRRNELYAPREGFTACQYCRKQVPTESMVEHSIIGRGRKQVWNSWRNQYESKSCVTTERMKFCSGKCAGNEQMSREG